MGEEATCHGHIVAQGDVSIGSHAVVYGNVIAGGRILLGAECCITGGVEDQAPDLPFPDVEPEVSLSSPSPEPDSPSPDRALASPSATTRRALQETLQLLFSLAQGTTGASQGDEGPFGLEPEAEGHVLDGFVALVEAAYTDDQPDSSWTPQDTYRALLDQLLPSAGPLRAEWGEGGRARLVLHEDEESPGPRIEPSVLVDVIKRLGSHIHPGFRLRRIPKAGRVHPQARVELEIRVPQHPPQA